MAFFDDVHMDRASSRPLDARLGVEVSDVDAVNAAQTRLTEAGLASVDERVTLSAVTPSETSSGC